MEEEDGDRQEEEEEEKGRSRIKESAPWMSMQMGVMKSAQDLSQEVCVYHHELWNKDARAVSVHVRHASVEVQVHCVNVVIGVVLGELMMYASFLLLFVMML